ncbi:MAG: S8 family serine peptidase [Thermoplasmata archaeon]|nr:MAG: S8 family serine peptidase [Thermoplasmata archaeon]
MVKSRAATSVATFLVLMFLIVPTLAAVATPEPIGEPRYYVIDDHLERILWDTPAGTELEAIVQFTDAIDGADRRAIIDAGLNRLYEYDFVNAVWIRGTPRAIEMLSAYEGVAWIEHNDQLEWMMDETTNVVNATRTWYSQVEGSLWGASGFDGKGVTVVVVDSGIDAGHPDLDYGTKTIRNLKSDTGTGPWYEIENGDTSSGHGTHVAGTVAGNGDASAGSRAGVAPGANLIGLSVGEAVFVTGGLGALEWVYEHSRPGNNPYNIRVCTNSWGGGGGQYDPQDSISQAINNLVYDNNVVTSFAAGNSGGTGDTIQASNYGNTPAAVNVAAATRDGTGITSFSSKGMWNWVDTWPDVAAPGQDIQSTAARRTLISLLQRGADANPYYFAISGTSMATPHVAGAAAVLMQAAPSLRVSEERQDVGLVTESDGTFTVGAPEEDTYGSLAHGYEAWLEEALDTRIHEVELILKLTADYIPAYGEPDLDANNLTENFVPAWSVPGFAADRQHDFSQGYGLMNLYRAVGLALTVEKIRWDHPEATVLDAYRVFEDVFSVKEISASTDQVNTFWTGEWSRFTEDTGSIFKPEAFTSNLTRIVYVPEGAGDVTVTLSYSPVDTMGLSAGSLGFRVDYGNDGSWDYDSGLGPNLDGTRTETIPASGSEGQRWKFAIYGTGFKIQRPVSTQQFEEIMMEVDVAVAITFPSAEGTIPVNETDLHAINGHLRLAPPTAGYTAGNVSVLVDVYDLNNVQYEGPYEPPTPPSQGSTNFWLWFLLFLVFLVVVAFIIARYWPESRAGRTVLKVAAVTRADRAYRWSKGTTVRTYRKVRSAVPTRKVVKAEVVEEGDSSGS